MNIIKTIAGLNLPFGQYIVFGSGPMAIHGIRPAQDIDLFISPALYHDLQTAGWVETGSQNHRHVSHGKIEAFTNWDFGDYRPQLNQLLQQAEIINGIAVAPLTEVIRWKQACARPKDLTDIQLIKRYLKES